MEEHKVNISQKTFIFRNDGRFLALRRVASMMFRPRMWDLPGGMFEYGEIPKDSARREISEETNLVVGELTPVTIESEVHKGGICLVTVAYRTDVQGGELKLSSEHDEYKWVTPVEFLALESSPKWERITQENFT